MKLLLASGVAVLVAAFQMPAEPPMKMGLWEITAVSKMQMADMPAAMANMPGMGPRTTKIHACLTKENYEKAFAQGGPQAKNCTISNQSYSAGKYSFDMSCNEGKLTGHYDGVFESPTAGHATTHMQMNGGKMTIDATTTSSFLSEDCAGVSPDKPQLIK
jgi:hypothetical protein